MNKNTVYKDATGVIVICGDEQQIEVSEETAVNLTMRLCSLLNWKVKPSTLSFQGGFVGLANANCTKENPLGGKHS